MIDTLIQVLSLKKVGKKIHADKIKVVYHRKINELKRCDKCCEGMVGPDVIYGFS